jgi:oligosaccharide repeat unit polymerase
MSILSYICFLLVLALLATILRKNTDAFSPARLFLIIWLIAIGLTDLKLSRYQKQWSDFSWIALLISLFSTLAGMFIVYVINYGKPIKSVNSIRQLLKSCSINSKLLFKYIIILFLAYILSYLVTYWVVGYITLFTSKPDLARRDWQLFGFGLFVQSIPAILYLIVVYFVLIKSKISRKFILLILFLIAFVTYFFLLQRYYLIFSIFVSLVFLYYSTHKIRARNVLFLIPFLAVIFYWVSSIRLGRYLANYLYYLSKMKFSIKYSLFTEPYMYIVMNLENFAHAVEKLQNFTYGIYSFDFLLAITGIKHTLAEYLHLSEYPNLITGSFNTYTMFFIFYRDFSFIGLCLVPLLFGMFFSNAYYKMRISPDINSISIYAIIVFLIVFSFFVPLMTFLHFIFNFIIIYLVTRLISENGKKWKLDFANPIH